VCELHANGVPSVQVVLDTHAPAHSGSGGDSSLEWAIRIAASFLESWIAQGADVEAVFDGQVISSRDRSIPARRERVLDALAQVEPGGILTLADLLELPACRDFAGGLRVVVTTDTGLSRLPRRRPSAARERFVVLRAASFTDEVEHGETEALAVRPWILVDDPRCVPQRIRQAWKEVLLA
jgi:uncharacterized protein (DUF58 family)